MSKFYDQIAKYYDRIFPLNEDILNLIRENSQPGDRLLDVACGDGKYSIALARLGYRLTGIDLNSKMIDQVRKNDRDIDARVLNMLDIDSLEDSYKLIFSVGNSLVHLKDDREIGEFLDKAYDKLEDKGKIIIGIINYNRILDQDLDGLPLIENKDLKFYRNYQRQEGDREILFKTRLEVDGRIYDNTEVLYPIRMERLSQLIEESGFKNLKVYGGFKKAPYSKDAMSLAFIAEK